MSACDSARFLQVIVDAVDELLRLAGVEEAAEKEGEKVEKLTFSGLSTKLEALLADNVGGTPTVDVSALYDAETGISDLRVNITLNWEFIEARSIGIDLKEILDANEGEGLSDDGEFLHSLVPAQGEGEFELSGTVQFDLGVGVEFNRTAKSISPYIMSTSGFKATFDAQGDLDFQASLGPLRGEIAGRFFVGQDNNPLSLEVGLKDDSDFYYISSKSGEAARPNFEKATLNDLITKKLGVQFEGNAGADITLCVPLICVEDAGVDFDILDLEEFIRGGSGNDVVTFKVTPPQSNCIGKFSFLDILLQDPEAVVNALDEIFGVVEDGKWLCWILPNSSVVSNR